MPRARSRSTHAACAASGSPVEFVVPPTRRGLSWRAITVGPLLLACALVLATPATAAESTPQGVAQRSAVTPAQVPAMVPAGVEQGRRYVALGDSYAAGPLIPLPTGTPPGCLRSTGNYPQVTATALGAALTDVSCSGATTAALTAPQRVPLGLAPAQLDAVTAATELVTLTIGGNDIGFAEIVQQCASRSGLAPAGAACRDFYRAGGTDQLASRIAATAPAVAAVLDGIGERAPQARVLLVGYPAILPVDGPGCFPQVPFSAGDTAWLRSVTEDLNAMLAAQAADRGAEYVDVYGPTAGHDICTPPGTRFVEPLVPVAPAAPVHPNAQGMAAIGAVVAATVTGATSGPTAA